eukprot:jgi/Undpi1/8439/HiC_scaffold_25.g10907.m1
MLGRSEVVESTKSTHMARNSDKGIAGSEEQKRKRPTKSLCHHHKHHHHFFSSPNSMAVSSSLLPILLFITCFLVSGTSSFTTSLTTSGPPAANRGVKKAFLGIPVDFPRPPRQRSQAGLGGASSPLSAVTRSPHDGKAGGIKGFFNSERGADPERTGRAGSAMVLQEAFFSTWRRWSSAASLLGSPAHVARARTAATQTTTTTATTTPPSVANLTHTSIKLLPPASPRGLLASCPRGGRGSNNGRLNGVGCRTRGGVRGRASLARLACSVVLLPPAVSVGAGPAVAAVVGGAGASGAGLGGGAAVASGPCSLVATLLANQWWGAAVSSPLVTMLLTITLCNVGFLPAASPVYDTVNKVFVPLAVPLLLFDADLRKVIRFAGTLLACFVIGAAGTVIGTAAAAAVVPLGLGNDGWKIASALAARHIGGAVNYVAVCETLGVSADAVVAGLAADNMVVSLYFVFLFWITKPEKATPQLPPPSSRELPSAERGVQQEAQAIIGGGGDTPLTATKETISADEGVPQIMAQNVVEAGENEGSLSVSKETISYALSAACALCLSGELLSKVAFGGRVSAIPLVTLATVGGATAAPSFVGRLGPVGAQLGVLFMQLFFAVTGAQGSLAVVMGTAPSLLIFSLVQIAVHFSVLVGVGKLCRLPFRELALASNANVGGPTTAAAMAAAKGWKNLVLPALLTGVLGYATATFIGVGMGHAVLKSLIGGVGG